jgi:hypothetical protein
MPKITFGNNSLTYDRVSIIFARNSGYEFIFYQVINTIGCTWNGVLRKGADFSYGRYRHYK